MHADDFLQARLDERIQLNALRQLTLRKANIDFCSNDYLGIATRGLYNDLKANHGSKGSRLLAGNYALAEETESLIASFHQAEAALLFNSGFDANLGVLGSIPQKGDTVLYDQLSHASIRDGIRLSNATAYSFLHNDLEDLEKKCKASNSRLFIVTEAVFSMDGDYAPLEQMLSIAKKYDAHLIVDEAHAIGVTGNHGAGLSQSLQLHQDVFCRIYTYGKAGGCHGAAVTGSKRLREYLINFARSLIYTTALPPLTTAAIQKFYLLLPQMNHERKQLAANIQLFRNAALRFQKLDSATAIQGIFCEGNQGAKAIANTLQENDLDVRPVLYPTVPKGKERLRIILHSFNTEAEVNSLIQLLQ